MHKLLLGVLLLISPATASAFDVESEWTEAYALEALEVVIQGGALDVAEEPDAKDMCDRAVRMMEHYCSPADYNKKLCNAWAGLAAKWCEKSEEEEDKAL